MLSGDIRSSEGVGVGALLLLGVLESYFLFGRCVKCAFLEFL